MVTDEMRTRPLRGSAVLVKRLQVTAEIVPLAAEIAQSVPSTTRFASAGCSLRAGLRTSLYLTPSGVSGARRITNQRQTPTRTGTIRLKATFPNKDDKPRPGQFASARAVVDTLFDAKVVPATAIRRSTSGTFVYLADEEERASVRPVNVLLEEETYAVVGDGIDLGSRVVTLGFDQLKHGKAVRIVKDASVPATAQVLAEPSVPVEGEQWRHQKDHDPSNPSVKRARTTKKAER